MSSQVSDTDRPLSPRASLRRQIATKKAEIAVIEKKREFFLNGVEVPELPDLVLPTNLTDRMQSHGAAIQEMTELKGEVNQLEAMLDEMERKAKIRHGRHACV
jgi:hypothetical protein